MVDLPGYYSLYRWVPFIPIEVRNGETCQCAAIRPPVRCGNADWSHGREKGTELSPDKIGKACERSAGFESRLYSQHDAPYGCHASNTDIRRELPDRQQCRTIRNASSGDGNNQKLPVVPFSSIIFNTRKIMSLCSVNAQLESSRSYSSLLGERQPSVWINRGLGVSGMAFPLVAIRAVRRATHCVLLYRHRRAAAFL